MGRIINSDADCSDCLCRVCARNNCNDSYNQKLKYGEAMCTCDCSIGDEIIESQDDCPIFLADEG